MKFFTFNAKTLEITAIDLTKEESRKNIPEELPVCQEDFSNLEVGMFLTPNKQEVCYKTYSERRALKYPALEDQLDAIWHAVSNNEELIDSAWFNGLKDIKSSIPKEPTSYN